MNQKLKRGMIRQNDIKWRLENYSVTTNNGCREWQNYRNPLGYGKVRYNGKKELAHRVAYIIYKGDFDRSLKVCHTCDNPSCINPEHLFLGTDLDNVRDCASKGRHKGFLNSPFTKRNQYARK